MSRLSAGIVLYRWRTGDALEVLLVHPGGPYWERRDEHAWSIPKGEVEEGQLPTEVAAREFSEELGHPVPPGPWVELGEIRQKAGKRVLAWAVEGDVPVERIKSNSFEMQWPPRSGRTETFPEVDRAEWTSLDKAATKLVEGQTVLLDRLRSELCLGAGGEASSAP